MIGKTRKPMSTTKCVGAVMLSETHGVLHGAQIPETPRAGTQVDCLPLTTVPRPTSAEPLKPVVRRHLG